MFKKFALVPLVLFGIVLFGAQKEAHAKTATEPSGDKMLTTEQINRLVDEANQAKDEAKKFVIDGDTALEAAYQALLHAENPEQRLAAQTKAKEVPATYDQAIEKLNSTIDKFGQITKLAKNPKFKKYMSLKEQVFTKHKQKTMISKQEATLLGTDLPIATVQKQLKALEQKNDQLMKEVTKLQDQAKEIEDKNPSLFAN